MALDFCRVEVTLIHDLIEEVTTTEETPIDYASAISFDNTEVEVSISYVNNVDSSADELTLKFWNLPIETELIEGDYVIYEYYWEGEGKTRGSGKTYARIDEVNVSVDSLDISWTVKATKIENYLFNKMPFTVNEIINNLADFERLVQERGYKNIYSQIEGFTNQSEFDFAIKTKGKTPMEISEEIRLGLVEQLGQQVRISVQNKQNIILYDKYAEYNNESITVTTYTLDEVFKYKHSATAKEGALYYVYYEIFGMPTVKAGTLIKFEGELYKVEEVTHKIESDSGYNMSVLAYRKIPVTETEE